MAPSRSPDTLTDPSGDPWRSSGRGVQASPPLIEDLLAGASAQCRLPLTRNDRNLGASHEYPPSAIPDPRARGARLPRSEERTPGSLSEVDDGVRACFDGGKSR